MFGIEEPSDLNVGFGRIFMIVLFEVLIGVFSDIAPSTRELSLKPLISMAALFDSGDRLKLS